MNDQPTLGHSPWFLLSATAIPSSILKMVLSLFRLPDPLENLVKETNSSSKFCSEWLRPLKTPVLGDVGHQPLLPSMAVSHRADWSLASLGIRESFHLVASLDQLCKVKRPPNALLPLLRAFDSVNELTEGQVGHAHPPLFLQQEEGAVEARVSVSTVFRFA